MPEPSEGLGRASVRTEGAPIHPDDMAIASREQYERQCRAYVDYVGVDEARRDQWSCLDIFEAVVKEITKEKE